VRIVQRRHSWRLRPLRAQLPESTGEHVAATPNGFECATDPVSRTPNEQGAFGTGGAHFCLGAHLARREVTAMFVELFRRLPDIEATAEPEKLRSNFIRGIKRLPVSFGPA
jgi:cytochrome P450